eukprot:1187501-Prorocentrum_minimum.AAC.2
MDYEPTTTRAAEPVPMMHTGAKRAPPEDAGSAGVAEGNEALTTPTLDVNVKINTRWKRRPSSPKVMSGTPGGKRQRREPSVKP